MKIRTLLLATAMVASVTGAAFAQVGNGDASAKQAPMKQSNQPEPMKQDMTKKDTMKDSKGMAMKPGEATTGAAASSSKDVAKSPASTDAGIKQEK